MNQPRLVSSMMAVGVMLGWGLGTARATGVEPARLSLPKGPASVEGLGRNFEPSLASGTASYGVEIEMPPAPGGFAPGLSLEYDSGGGVTEVGMGWRLAGIPRVRARTQDGLPRFDGTDTYELAGLGTPCQLVEVADGTYRPAHEDGTFVRLTRAPNTDEWEARVKGGVTYRFGGPGNLEAEAGRIATYLLREQIDRHGHRIEYRWDAGSGYARLTSVLVEGTSTEPLIEVDFSYEERPDVVLTHGAGIAQLLDQRLSHIDIERNGERVREYRLGYSSELHPQIDTIQVVGADGATSLPALSFEYTRSDLSGEGHLTSMLSPPGRSPGDLDVELADLNGDGLPDLLVGESSAYRTYVNHDGRTWEDEQTWSERDTPSVQLSSRGVQLADLDGDGAIDLVAKSGVDSFRYLPGLTETRFASAVAITTVPNFSFEDPEVRLADMDGDRRTDVVITTLAGMAIAYNLGGSDWTEPELVVGSEALQRLRFSDGRTRLCDVNGDRVQDMCSLRSGALSYWLGRGLGRFDVERVARGVPEFDPANPWQLADLNGDGWADLVHVGVQRVEFVLAIGVGTFGPLQAVHDTPTKHATTTVKLADMNGSGSTDIVWIDLTLPEQDAWRYLELFPAGRAGLLREIDNGLGKVVRIAYEPASAAAARAREVNEPWTTRMNVAMPVVSRVEVDSSLGDPLLVTEYEYRDGQWDPQERTFAAFATGVTRELGDATTPTRITKTVFDTGVRTRVMRGQVLSVDQQSESGHRFSQTTHSYVVQELDVALDGRAIEYPYRASTLVGHVEGTDLSAARWTLTEWEQDAWGNVVREANWGEVVGEDPSAGDDEVVVIRTYVNDPQEWLLGYLVTEEVQTGSGDRVASKQRYYDGEPLVGLPLGRAERGLLRRVDSWISDDRFITEQRFDHDEHGNVRVVVDARGGRHEYDYDPSGTFVVAERRRGPDVPALEWTAEYDERCGAPTRVTDPNGAETRLAYDALGRVTRIAKPGDTLDLPTTEFSYELSAPLSWVRIGQREQSGQPGMIERVLRVDGLGRTRGEFEEGATEGSWVLTGHGIYDARGNVAMVPDATQRWDTELPSGQESHGARMHYDAQGRPVSVTQLDGASTRTVYQPLEQWTWDENDNDSRSEHYGTPTDRLFDGRGRLVAVIERDGDREVTSGRYRYDALGNLLEVIDANGAVRQYAYDGRSRRTTIEDPNAGEWWTGYTDGDDVGRRVDASGAQVRYVYDSLGRLLEEWHRVGRVGDEHLAARYHYDEPSAETGSAANLLGRLAWVEDEAGSVRFDYDERGREVRRIRRWEDGTEHATWYSFDAADRPVQRGFPDETYLDLVYDSRGMLHSVGAVVSAIFWTPDAKLERMVLGNGVVDERRYDKRRRVTDLLAARADGTVLRGLEYAYDATSRIRQVVRAESSSARIDPGTVSYRYDDRYRLTEATDFRGSTVWGYDDASNITAVESSGGIPWLNVVNRFGQDRAGPHRLTQHGDESLRYDAAGRVVEDGARLLSWDAKGRLRRVERDDVTEEYVYAYDDSRALKRTTEDGETRVVRYIDDDVEERDGRLVRYVFVGEQRVARLNAVEAGE